MPNDYLDDMRMPTVADVQDRLRQKQTMEGLGRQGELNTQMADRFATENQAALQGARPANREFDVQSKVYDDIGKYARSKMAGELKQKYLPEPEPTPPPLLEAPEAPEDDLDEESLQRLAAMAGE